MTYYKSKLEEVIKELIELELDGEDTQYILEQIGMDDQMAIQLSTKYSNRVQEHLNELKHKDLL